MYGSASIFRIRYSQVRKLQKSQHWGTDSLSGNRVGTGFSINVGNFVFGLKHNAQNLVKYK